MKPILKEAALVVLLAHCASASAAQPINGKAVYATCAACHGSRGEGNPALGAPNIAGMEAWYLKAQLDNFSAGRRGTRPGDTQGAQMRAGSAAANSPANRAAVVAYIAGLPRVPAKTKAPAKANLANGATHFNALCSACHNARASGSQALGAPRLAGLDSAYLRRQVSNFRAGLRGYDAGDKYGKQMAAISKMLDAGAEPDVLAYIQTLKP